MSGGHTTEQILDAVSKNDQGLQRPLAEMAILRKAINKLSSEKSREIFYLMQTTDFRDLEARGISDKQVQEAKDAIIDKDLKVYTDKHQITEPAAIANLRAQVVEELGKKSGSPQNQELMKPILEHLSIMMGDKTALTAKAAQDSKNIEVLSAMLQDSPADVKKELADANTVLKGIGGINGFDGNQLTAAPSKHATNPAEKMLATDDQQKVDVFISTLSDDAKKAIDLLNDVRMNAKHYKAPHPPKDGETDQQYYTDDVQKLKVVEQDPETIKLGKLVLNGLTPDVKDEIHNARLTLEGKGFTEVIWEPGKQNNLPKSNVIVADQQQPSQRKPG